MSGVGGWVGGWVGTHLLHRLNRQVILRNAVFENLRACPLGQVIENQGFDCYCLFAIARLLLPIAIAAEPLLRRLNRQVIFQNVKI